MWIARLLIFGLPWVAWPGKEDPFLGPKQAVFLVGCWSLLLTTWFSEHPTALAPWRNPWTRRFALWVLLFGAWRFWGPFLDRVPNGDFAYNMYIWEATLYVLTALLTVHCLTTCWLTSFARATQITQWVCQSSAVSAVYVIAQRCGIEQFYVMAQPWNETVGWFAGFGNAGMMASFLAMTVPLFLLFSKRRYLFFLAIALLALWISGARFAQAAAGVSLVVYGSLRLSDRIRPGFRWILCGGLILMACIGMRLAWHPLHQDERWPIWQETTRLWKQENADRMRFSWTGRGLETFPFFFMQPTKGTTPEIQAIVQKGGWRTAHNDALQALFEWGLIGAGLLLMMVWTTVRSAWQRRTTMLGIGWLSAASSLLMLSVTYFPWHTAPTAFLGMMIWAMNERQELSA